MTESAFQEKNKAAWGDVHDFLQKAKSEEEHYSQANPQHRLAPEFFQIYLSNRPSDIAYKALQTSCTMWGNLKGTSRLIEESIGAISYDEDVWEAVEHGLVMALSRDSREEDKIPVLEKLVEQVKPLKSRTALLFSLSREWMQKQEYDKARTGYELINQWC